MEPSRKSSKGSTAGDRAEKHCKTWWLVDWIRRGNNSGQENTFAQSAQRALDAEERPEPSPSPRGTLYRAGVALADLKPGECGTIRRLFGPTQGRLRLLEMGLTPGTHVKVVRAAAFGGPIDVLVRGYQLSLRREEAAGVWLDDEENERATTTRQATGKAK